MGRHSDCPRDTSAKADVGPHLRVGGVVTLRYYLTVCWDAFSLQFSERLSGEPDFDPNFFGRLP